MPRWALTAPDARLDEARFRHIPHTTRIHSATRLTERTFRAYACSNAS